jgi:hypothetical protein
MSNLLSHTVVDSGDAAGFLAGAFDRASCATPEVCEARAVIIRRWLKKDGDFERNCRRCVGCARMVLSGREVSMRMPY